MAKLSMNAPINATNCMIEVESLYGFMNGKFHCGKKLYRVIWLDSADNEIFTSKVFNSHGEASYYAYFEGIDTGD